MVADLGLLLIQLGEKVQKQRKAAVVLLHLAQVPRRDRRVSPSASSPEVCVGQKVCTVYPLNIFSSLEKPQNPGPGHLSTVREDGRQTAPQLSAYLNIRYRGFPTDSSRDLEEEAARENPHRGRTPKGR